MDRYFYSLLAGFLGLLLAVQVSAVTIGIPEDQGDHEYEILYADGARAIGKGQVDKAEALFQKSLQLYPEFIPSQLGMAYVAFSRGAMDKGTAIITDLYQRYPHDEHVLTSYGKLMYSKGQFVEAQTAFKLVLTKDDHTPAYFMNLADLYMSAPVGSVAEAAELYKQVLALAPEHAGANYSMGIALSAQNQPQTAIEYLSKAALLAPDNPLPLLKLASVSMQLDDLPAAERYARAALKLDADSVDAMFAVADVASARGQTEAAIAQYKVLAGKLKNDVRPYMRLGMEYQTQENWQAALDSYQQAVKINSDMALAYNNMAWIASEYLGDQHNARQWAEKAVELAPNIPAFYDTLGWVYKTAGQVKKAEAALEQSITLNPGYQPALFHLGLLYKEQQLTQQAVDSFNKVLSIDANTQVAAKAKQQLSSMAAAP